MGCLSPQHQTEDSLLTFRPRTWNKVFKGKSEKTKQHELPLNPSNVSSSLFQWLKFLIPVSKQVSSFSMMKIRFVKNKRRKTEFEVSGSIEADKEVTLILSHAASCQ